MGSREQVVTFQGHHSYIVSIARLCKENGLFTDVTLQCDDGKLLAHRIVLAAVSPFLRGILTELPGGTQDFTIIVPDVRRAIVQQLLDFLYTGSMQLEQEATYELQELVLLLKIDPTNVGVEVADSCMAARLVDTACQTLGVKIAARAELPHGVKLLPPSPPAPLPRLTIKTDLAPLTNGVHKPAAPTTPSRPSTRPKPLSSRPDYVESPPHSPPHLAPALQPRKLVSPGGRGAKGGLSPGATRGGHAATNGGRGGSLSPGSRGCNGAGRGGVPPLKLGGAKSKAAREHDQGDARVVGGSDQSTVSSVQPVQESLKIKISLGGARKRRLSSDTPSSSPSYSSSLSPGRGGEGGKRGRGVRKRGGARGRGRGKEGKHDWENSRTWMCAICGQYDPVQAQGSTTEWIGCDCNRWFHKFCTKLKSVGDDFSCQLVHKSCLPS